MNPREAAFAVLKKFDRYDEELDSIVDTVFETADLEVRDRRLAFQIIYGVLRNRNALDYVIDGLINQNLRKEPVLRQILQIGAFQILFLDRVPVHASVSETVNLTKNGHSSLQKFTGVVNAVLRNVEKKRKTVLQFPKSMDRIKKLSLKFSHPEWMIRRWMESFGGRKCENLLEFNNTKPTTFLRRNLNSVSKLQFESDISAVSPRSPQPVGFKKLYYELKPQVQATDIMSFGAGVCTVQAPSSGWVIALLDPQKNDVVLDVSAAPGGKSTLIGELVGDDGAVIAADNRLNRALLVEENVNRMGMNFTVFPVVCDGKAPAFSRQFDKVLLDAPCSGTGVMHRHPDSRLRRTEQDIINSVKLQEELLNSSAETVMAGGVLLYSTCSLENEENWGQVEKFLKSHPNFELEPADNFIEQKYVDKNGCLSITPYDHKMDGMFGARLVKKK
jgi:16S rRNA (cytosine967-C5)-methyltransferase